MDSKQDVKARNSFNKLCSILIDILIVPVLVIAFACAIIMSTAKANNKVPSVLGNSIVEVLSDSMDVEGGYKVGDVLIISQTNVNSLKVGDCIAFYAPKQSGYIYDDGNSMVIFHRIVRIINAIPYENGVAVSDVPVRHFVCRGDKGETLTKENGKLIPTQACIDGEENPGGDYDEFGNVKPNGGYVVKLDDDSNVEGGDNQVQNNQAEFQYVTDEFVVGKLKSRASGFISGVVKFCGSEKGIILLVIIPSLIMIALVLTSLINETKVAKQERENDQLVLARNISIMSSLPINQEQNLTKEEQEKQEEKTENKIGIESVINPIIQQKADQENLPDQSKMAKKDVPVVPEKPQNVNVNKKQEQKTEVVLAQPKISDKKNIPHTDKNAAPVSKKIATTPKKPVVVPKKDVNTVKKTETVPKKSVSTPKKSLPQKQTKTTEPSVPKKPSTKPELNKVPPKK